MEFETLDATDVKEIMSGTWDPEIKRGRLKAAEDLQMKTPPPPPPLPAKAPAINPEPGLSS